MENLSRRDFLNLFGYGFGGMWFLTLPSYLKINSESFPLDPLLQIDDLPAEIRDIIKLISTTQLDKKGYLMLHTDEELQPSYVPLVITDWNKKHSNSYDRLMTDQPLGIVLHWYGDRDNFDDSIEGYLRGFNSVRPVADYETITSAHFLIGSAEPKSADHFYASSRIGIIQTQSPDIDGVPFAASHIARMDYDAHEQALQYFVRSSYTLNQTEQYPLSILVDFFDGLRTDPNMRTIAIEITGHNFDNILAEIDQQKLANVVSVVLAVMKKYRIPALNILGHNEISLNKADPGKMFLATIRYLVCVKCLVNNDQLFHELVFEPFYTQAAVQNSDAITHKLFSDSELSLNIRKQAIINCLKYIRSYLLLVDTPANVYRWELICRYWEVYDLLVPEEKPQATAHEFLFPVEQPHFESRGYFLDENNREGINFHRVESDVVPSGPFSINLIANGECIFVGISEFYPDSFIAIFKHRLHTSAEVLSIYDNLSDVIDLKLRGNYNGGQVIGNITQKFSYIPAHLHFAIAFGSTWDLHIKDNRSTPLNAGPTWMRARYLDPINFLETHLN